MFSIFHKDGATLAPQKPADQPPGSAEQPTAVGDTTLPRTSEPQVVTPGSELHQAELGPAPATPDSAAAAQGQQANVAPTASAPANACDVGSPSTPVSAETCRAQLSQPQPSASPAGPSIRWVDGGEDAFPQDDGDIDPDEASLEQDEESEAEANWDVDEAAGTPSPMGTLEAPHRLTGRRKGKPAARGPQLQLPEASKRTEYTPQQRLLMLDTWRRSGLPAQDFASLVGVSKHTLYKWKQLFEEQGPAGLMEQPRGQREGSRLPELTKRTILMLKEQHPEWGCQRISDLLVRGPALPASASAVARVLHEAGYEAVEETTRPHPDHVRRFERAKPNQLWQTDLFTFVLKRQNRRLYLVAFLDDHSRFLISYGLHASQSTALVLEVLEAGIGSYGPPEEILTDNGTQYVTWRGKSQFTRRLEQHGIRQLVARPHRPQTLGKIERFWGTLWREFLETAVFTDLADARTRIGHFIDYYNFQRPHRAAEGLVPADRFFQAAPTVLQTLKERVAANALELARDGKPKTPFYVTGQVAGQAFSVHAEGERLVLRRQGQEREEIQLAGNSAPTSGSQPEAGPAMGSVRADSLPAPLCPDGSPQPSAGEPACAPPPSPGHSGLDLTRLAQGLGGLRTPPSADQLPPANQPKPGGAS